MHNIESSAQSKFEKQDKQWQKKMSEMKKQHAEELRKLNSVLEKKSEELATRRAKGKNSAMIEQQQQEVEKLIRVGNSWEIKIFVYMRALFVYLTYAMLQELFE